MAVYQGNKTKDGRSWYFANYKKDFNGENKKYKSKKYLTKKEALEEERLFLIKRDNPIHKSFKLIAKSYFDELLKINKESSYYSYKNAYDKNILPYFNNCYIDTLTISDINNWKEKLEAKNYKLAYLNKMYVILNNIFNHAVKKYGLTSNPVSLSGRFQRKNEDIIKDEEKLRYIRLEDFNQFISVIDNSLWKTFFIFLYYTGMRKGEIQALTWKDINFNDNEIIVNKTLSVKTTDLYKITSTKNYINRRIKMSKTLREQLLQYKNEVIQYNDFSENWFVFGNSRFLAQTSIDRNKHKYFKLSKVNEITIHEFRHSHVSLLINEYVKSGQTDTTKFFLMMSNRMGHSLGVMQKTYMHLFPTIQNEIVNILDNL